MPRSNHVTAKDDSSQPFGVALRSQKFDLSSLSGISDFERSLRKQCRNARRPPAGWEERITGLVGVLRLFSDNVDFSAILALAEPILAEARRLAEWAHDGHLDYAGHDMLVRIGKQWLALESVLSFSGMGPENAGWCMHSNDDRVYIAAQCWTDLAWAVRRNADWLKSVSDFHDPCFVDLAPDACMGMPHALFAKRLAVTVELLKKIVGPHDPAFRPASEGGDPEHSARVVLRDREEGPIVLGKTKRKLTNQQYNVVKALLEAGDLGLTKDELVSKSGHEDARGILKRLADSDPDWKGVIHFAGRTGGRYRIK
jgi:hypothetical protein